MPHATLSDAEVEAMLEAHVPSGRGARGSKAQGAGQAPRVTRELEVGDLQLVANPPEVGSTTPSLVKLRTPHHLIARLLAEGRKGVEVAAITGFSQSRISILQGDPAFQELMAYYGAKQEAAYLSVHERLAALGEHATQELHERLEEAPEGFTSGQLMDLVEMTMDRTVAPKKAGQQSLPAGAGALPPAIQINFVRSRFAEEIDQVTVETFGQSVPTTHLPGA